MTGSSIDFSQTPVLSVIMANYNGAKYLEAAVNSALSQTLHDIEVIVADDGSTDNSLDILYAMQAEDRRLIVLPAQKNAGPGDARNRAIERANGEWLAIVDADDVMEPHRFAHLIACANVLGADFIADDQICFSADNMADTNTLFQSHLMGLNMKLSPAVFVKSGDLGFMKPLIRADSLGDLRYRTDIRNGEDFDFYLKYLMSNAKAFLVNKPLYFYRRHSASISHRWSVADIRVMIKCNDDISTSDAATRAALKIRRDRLERALAFELLMTDIKARRRFSAAKRLCAKPFLFGPLARALRDKLWRSKTEDAVTKIALQVVKNPRDADDKSIPQI
ncbi:glycosyltransferase family 2 protein [Parasulfitobacter algicola]|uniref:Glycosyltransferase n=1 Tax=Parasulfitobacter algicola TaxID=2614809 RepID=A0ABX2IPT6_9RHOB|nr:glycosyltransferase family 2 protein [Sulfitobacter algicola]NSX54899.1 glycosyltransferase [Sulfitobacter algicola]